VKSNKGLAKENKECVKMAERIKEIQKHGYSRREKPTRQATYARRNFEGFSWNHCCRGEAIRIT
jgi:hypothetical protein